MGPGEASGAIVLAATPLGHDGDASDRLRTLLSSADVVAAEDTRRLRGLAARLGVRIGGRVVSYYDANEAARAVELVARAQAGATILVVSDAGMPGISDPGYRLVRAARAAGVPVTCAPGPSALLAALALSGLPTDRFAFEGFWPRRASDRALRLRLLATEPRTMAFFESPRRLASTLAEMAEGWGVDREACVARELTKVHEEVVCGTLGELVEWAAQREVLGEVTLVVAGAPAPTWEDSADSLVAEVLSRVNAGERLSEAAAQVARQSGAPRRALYELARNA